MTKSAMEQHVLLASYHHPVCEHDRTGLCDVGRINRTCLLFTQDVDEGSAGWALSEAPQSSPPVTPSQQADSLLSEKVTSYLRTTWPSGSTLQ